LRPTAIARAPSSRKWLFDTLCYRKGIVVPSSVVCEPWRCAVRCAMRRRLLERGELRPLR